MLEAYLTRPAAVLEVSDWPCSPFLNSPPLWGVLRRAAEMITPRAPVWRSKRRNFAVAALLAAAAAAAVLGAAGDCDACIARVAAAQGARADAAAALQYARSLARDHPDEPCVWHCSGVAAYFAGSADEALRAFQRAVALEPSAAHLTNLGVVANSVGGASRPAPDEARFCCLAHDPSLVAAQSWSSRPRRFSGRLSWTGASRKQRSCSQRSSTKAVTWRARCALPSLFWPRTSKVRS